MKKIFKFVKGLFLGFDVKDKKAIQDAIQITEKIKNFTESSYMPVLIAIIPGYIDDILAKKLEQAIPKFLKLLRLMDNESLSESLANIKHIDPLVKGDFLDAIAAHIAVVCADGRLTWSEAKSVMKVVYDEKKPLSVKGCVNA